MRRIAYIITSLLIVLAVCMADTYTVRVYPYIVPTSESVDAEFGLPQHIVFLPGNKYAYVQDLGEDKPIQLVIQDVDSNSSIVKLFDGTGIHTGYQYAIKYDKKTNAVDLFLLRDDRTLDVYRVSLDGSVHELVKGMPITADAIVTGDTAVLLVGMYIDDYSNVLIVENMFTRVNSAGVFENNYANIIDTGYDAPLHTYAVAPYGVEYVGGKYYYVYNYQMLVGDPAESVMVTVYKYNPPLTQVATDYTTQGAVAACPDTNEVLVAVGQKLYVGTKELNTSVTSPASGACIHGMPVISDNDRILYADSYLDSAISVSMPNPDSEIPISVETDPDSLDGWVCVLNGHTSERYCVRYGKLVAHFDPGVVYATEGSPATVYFGVDSPDPNANLTADWNIPSWVNLSDTCIDCNIVVTTSDTNDDYGLVQADVHYVPEKYPSSEYTFTAALIVVPEAGQAPPSIPVLIDEPDTNETTVTLEWHPSSDPNGDPIHYEVWVYDENDNNVALAVTTDTEYTVSDLTPGVTYFWTVRACDENACSQWADADQFKVIPAASVEILAPEDGAYYTTATVNYVVKYFTNQSPAALYIETSTDGSSWDTVDTYDVSGSSGTASGILSLSDGTYFVRARMVTALGEDYDIVQIQVVTTTTYTMRVVYPYDGQVFEVSPGATVAIQATAEFNTEPDVGNREYKIVAVGPDGTTTFATATTDEPTYTLSGTGSLGEGNYLIYPVYVSPDGDTFYGSPVSIHIVASATANNPPSVPELIDEPDTTEPSVTLEWHASTDPEGDPIHYLVQLSLDPQFDDIVLSEETTSTSIEVNGLVGGHTYYWRVQACDDKDACSDWSDPDYFTVYETTAIEIVEPPDGSSYVVDENGTAQVPIDVVYTSNTDQEYNLVIFYTGTSSGTIVNMHLQAPFEGEYNTTYPFAEGNYTIFARLVESNTLTVVSEENVSIYVYPAGTPTPEVTLIDPPDGYYEEVPIGETSTITTRAEFNLVQNGLHTIAIEYKLRWATDWTTVTAEVVEANDESRHFTLTDNVTLGEGIYYFRAKVIDPNGNIWYSDIHSVTIRAVQTGGGGGGGEGGGGGAGGGGGGGGGGAPLLVGVEAVEVNVPEGGEETFEIPVKNTGTHPIRVKITYSDEIKDYIELPPDGTSVVLKVGDTLLKFKATAGDLKAGSKVTGDVIFVVSSGSSIKVPVTINVVSGAGGVAYKISKELVVSVAAAAALALLLAYLYTAGVIG